jgi:putative membrane fusion protein
LHQEFLTKNTRNNKNKIKLRKQRKERAILLVITGIILIFVSLSLINFTKSWIGERLVKLAELEEKELITTVTLTGYILKDESLLFAPVAGQLEIIALEGERIGVGGTVAKITGGYDSKFENRAMQEILAPTAGIVSYEIDGFESILDINSYHELELIKMPEPIKLQHMIINRVEKGQPVGKIINNLKPVGILVFLESGEEQEQVQLAVQQNSQAIFKLGDGSLEFVPARLVRANLGENKGMMIFETSGFYQDLYHLRKINLELVLEHYRGLVVGEQALVYEQDKPGLITVDRNNTYIWQPVDITGQIGSELVITGLRKGTNYIKNPR